MKRRLPLPLALLRQEDGAAAVEVALLVPILLTLFMGMFEVTTVLIADMKLTAAAQTAADLVAQTDVSQGALTASSLSDYTNAVEQVMTPLPANSTNLKIAYASVTYSTGSPVIDWHVEVNNATALTIGTMPSNENMTNLGDAQSGSFDSVIVVKVQYTYVAPLSFVLNLGNFTLTEAAFERPRYLTCVPLSGTSGAEGNSTSCP